MSSVSSSEANQRQALWFVEPHKVEIRSEDIADPEDHQVQIKTIVSAISPGTELKVFKGQFHQPSEEGECNSKTSDAFQYPLQFGYSSVGTITKIGRLVNQDTLSRHWKIGDTVFSFSPHNQIYNVCASNIFLVPEDIDPRDAVFLSNVETAVNFIHDSEVSLGETAVVFGQGIVGLLTTCLLQSYPLVEVATFDLCENRRGISQQNGAAYTFDPRDKGWKGEFERQFPLGADVVFEVSGSTHALSAAVECTGHSGRLVIGSWYGDNLVQLQLGEKFHRSQMTIKASQVSQIPAKLTGRWSKSRRFDIVWKAIRLIKPKRFISHEYTFEQAQDAFELLDTNKEGCLQAILKYN